MSREGDRYQGLWKGKRAWYISKAFTQKQIKEMPPKCRLVIRENKYHTNNQDGTPRFIFTFVEAEDAQVLRFGRPVELDNDRYHDEEGNRLYTEEEVRAIINGTVADVEYGIHDPYDILPEDFV